tara:strand:- start:110 stop:559 length:450 start_codon:yes stop_codon:yes gene_type:complete
MSYQEGRVRTVEERVKNARIADSMRPVDKFPIGRLNYHDDYCFAYSGSILNSSGVGSANISMLNFVTGNEYIIAKFQASMSQSSGHDFYLDIKFNDMLIVEVKEDSSDVEGWPLTYELHIPPFTKVEVLTGANTSGYDYQINMVGKVCK